MTAEKKQQIKECLLDTLTVFTVVLPMSLCGAVFMGFHYSFGIIMSIIASLVCAGNATKKIMPAFSVFLILMYVSTGYGTATLSFACLIGGILSAVYFFLPQKNSINDNPATTGLMLSTALSVTVMLTTHYFGIGASGDTVKEMIASYLSLGFHPNWRGVLYGTVVMVIMITFPRKFKSLCSYVKAPFIAVIVTLILNLFLNPTDFRTAINEIGNTFIFDKDIRFLGFVSHDTLNIPTAIICGIAIFIVTVYSLRKTESDKTEKRISALFNVVSGASFGLILPYGTKSRNKKKISAVFASVLCLVFMFIPNVNRIPLHSLAVIMIVGAWESVEWKKIKEVFSSVTSVIFFVLSFVATLYFGYVYGILICAILYIIYSTAFQKKTDSLKTNTA